MTNEGRKINRVVPVSRVSDLLGDLTGILSRIRSHRLESIYLTGGTVRDLLLARKPVDIDLTVQERAKEWAVELAAVTGGTLVPLGRDEDAARVVWLGRDIDFSSFRQGAATIDEELIKRDITINSLAIALNDILGADPPSLPAGIEIIDPTGGGDDLEKGCIRVTSDNAFRSDPLRMLRVFRFAATLGFAADTGTVDMVVRQKEWISRCSSERVAHELELIMQSARAYSSCRNLADSGLLFEIIPELRAGVGMEQPASHHLDVFTHSLATLMNMESILVQPERYFPADPEAMKRYIRKGRHAVQLKWAALFHDLGKPPTLAIDEERGGRITFYNHDRAGAELAGEIARRLRWSREDEKNICELVGLHMRPFFLNNVRRKGELTVRAGLRLLRSAGPGLPGLFLLGMADAAAGRGTDRPEDIEREVAELFHHLEHIRHKYLEPVRSRPPLLTGKDLIDALRMEPGPVFREVLDLVEEEHMVNNITTREEALELARTYVQEAGKKRGSGSGNTGS